jgi:hypothetical protein
MYNKCCYTFLISKKLTDLQQITLSLLFSNHIIPLQLILRLYYTIFIIDNYYQHIIEVKRRCNCRSMICFRTGQRQMSTNDMLININNHVSSNYIHYNNVHF